jgi:hypothetical protein
MNLQQPIGRRDAPSEVLGDRYFLGVDERRAPNQLPEGYVSAAKNCRFRNGKIEPRGGVRICPWLKDDGRTPFQEVYGAIVFADPNQAGDWIVIAADGGVWKTRPNMAATAVPLPATVSLTADTFAMFVPCTDNAESVLVLLRGPDADPLVCVNLDIGFTAVPAADVPGLRSMPRSRFGLNLLNRLLLVEDRDLCAVSDLLSFHNFAALQNEFRINTGQTDRLERLEPLIGNRVLCFKTQSVLEVRNVGADLAEAVGPLEVTRKYGLAAPLGVARNGANCYWITGEPAVASLRLTELNETQDTDVRLSDPLVQTFGRINGLALRGVVLEIWDGKLYVALPLDDALAHPDAVVSTPRRWEDGPSFDVGGLTAGQAYYFTKGNAEYLAYVLPDGGVATLETDGWFTPATSFVQVYGEYLATWTGSVAWQRPGRTNNAIAVFDFVTGAWAGVDEAAGVYAVKAFLKTAYQGRERLFLIGSDGVLRLLEEGSEDEVFTAAREIEMQPITTRVRTRAYQVGDKGRALSWQALLKTWAPTYTIRTVRQDYNRTETLQPDVTRDNTTYAAFGTEAWDASNANDDHGNPGREDYSVTLPEAGFNLGSGVNFDAHQTSVERVPAQDVGWFWQLELENTQGRCEVLQASVEVVTPEERLSGAVI